MLKIIWKRGVAKDPSSPGDLDNEGLSSRYKMRIYVYGEGFAN